MNVKRKWKTISIIFKHEIKKIELDENEKLPKDFFPRTRKCRSADYVNTLGKYNCLSTNSMESFQSSKTQEKPTDSTLNGKKFANDKISNQSESGSNIPSNEIRYEDTHSNFSHDKSKNLLQEMSHENAYEFFQDDLFAHFDYSEDDYSFFNL